MYMYTETMVKLTHLFNIYFSKTCLLQLYIKITDKYSAVYMIILTFVMIWPVKNGINMNISIYFPYTNDFFIPISDKSHTIPITNYSINYNK